MATNPLPIDDPVAEEGVRLMREDPELLASLEDIERRFKAGEIKPRDNNEGIRRRFGLPPLTKS